MGKSFKRNDRYNNWQKDKGHKKGNKNKFNYQSATENIVDFPQVKSYSPFEDSQEYHESFAG
jgi:hypothetical protein